MRLTLILTVLPATLIATASADCDLCNDLILSASGGLEEEWPRLMGGWTKTGIYNGKPFYTCTECMGSRDQLIFQYEEGQGQWTIVDCLPDATTACGGSHVLISTSSTDLSSCPYDAPGPFRYCSGNLVPGSGCTEYKMDATAGYDCAGSSDSASSD